MPKIRVLVVDDAVVIRRLVTETLSRDPDIEVAGAASNGSIALQKIPQLNPDIITLDIEMPEMDGLETLRQLRKLYPKLPVIMFSTLTSRGGIATLDALSLGATDYVTKPSNIGSVTEAIAKLEKELIPKIKTHCAKRPVAAPVAALQKSVPTPMALLTKPAPVDIVCIGTSTGGPNALAEVFKKMPANFPVPIVIVQHMPPLFTAILAERLGTQSPVIFQEGAERQVLEPGHAYIAPGGKHMDVVREGGVARLHLHDGTPENSCRPAVDVLFRSVVGVYGKNTLAVVMTGMGQDGLRGCQLVREQGGQVVVQDEPTSVVWGMPGAVANSGVAHKIVPLADISGEIVNRVRASRRAAA